jgi:signal transduction histidine kinase
MIQYMIVASLRVFAFCLIYCLSASAQETPLATESAAKLSDEDASFYYKLKDHLKQLSQGERQEFITKLASTVDETEMPLAYVRLKRLEADMFITNNDLANAVVSLNVAIEKSLGFPFDRGDALMEMAEIFKTLFFFNEALLSVHEAKEEFSKEHHTKKIISADHELMLLYLRVGNYVEGLKFVPGILALHKNASLLEDGVMRFYLMSGYNTTGLLYHRLAEYDSALKYYTLAESVARQESNQYWITNIRGNAANPLFEIGHYEKSELYTREDLASSAKNNHWGSAAGASMLMARIHLKRGNLKAAQSYRDSGWYYLRHLDRAGYEYHHYRQVAYELEKDIFSSTGKKDQLLQTWAKLDHLKDSLQMSKVQNDLVRLKSKLDFNRKQNELATLMRDSQLQKASAENKQLLLISTIIINALILALAIVLGITNRKKTQNLRLITEQKQQITRQKEELESQGEQLRQTAEELKTWNDNLEGKVTERTLQFERAFHELDFFLYRSSHDFRRPISTLMGLVNLMGNNSISDKEEVLKLMRQTLVNMDAMLNKLQMIHFVNLQKVQAVHVNLTDLVGAIIEKMTHRFGKSHVNFVSNGIVFAYVDPRLFEIIASNLLDNSFQFSNQYIASEIKCELNAVNGDVMFSVWDNGIGIPEEIRTKVFELFFRGTELSTGNGLGLYVAEKAARLLNGSITLKSDPGNWTHALVRLGNVSAVSEHRALENATTVQQPPTRS